MLELAIIITGIIFVSYTLGHRNAKEVSAEAVVDLVITRLCHDGYIHYKEMDDGDYDLIKIKDFKNGGTQA